MFCVRYDPQWWITPVLMASQTYRPTCTSDDAGGGDWWEHTPNPLRVYPIGEGDERVRELQRSGCLLSMTRSYWPVGTYYELVYAEKELCSVWV